MYLVNNTPIPVALVPNAERDRVVTLLVLAATYEIEPRRLVVAEEQRPLVLLSLSPYVSDAQISKVGVSVCATGFVYPREPGARQAIARLCVGEAEIVIAAFGKRVWREGLGGALTATTPLPIERVEMTWQNAYGGSVWRPTSVIKVKSGEEAIVPEHDEAFPLNIDGVGYYPSRKDAVDQPLPQLERPEQLITRWEDQPEPVCFAPYPLYGGLRAQTVLTDDSTVDYARHGRALSRAAPRTTFEEILPGTVITLQGMRPAGEALSFTVPPPPVIVDAAAGARGSRLRLSVDAIDIDAEARVARIAYRALFSYELIQHEIRVARVEATPLFASMLRAAPR